MVDTNSLIIMAKNPALGNRSPNIFFEWSFYLFLPVLHFRKSVEKFSCWFGVIMRGVVGNLLNALANKTFTHLFRNPLE